MLENRNQLGVDEKPFRGEIIVGKKGIAFLRASLHILDSVLTAYGIIKGRKR
jgi:hypothetical protein